MADEEYTDRDYVWHLLMKLKSIREETEPGRFTVSPMHALLRIRAIVDDVFSEFDEDEEESGACAEKETQ